MKPTTNPSSNPTSQSQSGIVRLTSNEFRDGLVSGRFDVIVDVRTVEEWDTGHIDGATLLPQLDKYGTVDEVSTPVDLTGCEEGCAIVVYCDFGDRAQTAATILAGAGYQTPIYNGLGVTQWTDAGYPLVTTAAVTPPPCLGNRGFCTDPNRSSRTTGSSSNR